MKEDGKITYLFGVMQDGVINTYFGNCQTFASFLCSFGAEALSPRFSTISVIRLTTPCCVWNLGLHLWLTSLKFYFFSFFFGWLVGRRSLSSESLVHVSLASLFVSHGMEYGQVICFENFTSKYLHHDY